MQANCPKTTPPFRARPSMCSQLRCTAANTHSTSTPLIHVIMGVSGCGKSVIGAALASKLKCPFYDADRFHPASNISKMQADIPLSDDDRWPWLERLRQLLAEHVAQQQPAVLACSALKPAYRQLLRRAADGAAQCDTVDKQQQGRQQQQQQQQQQEAECPQASQQDLTNSSCHQTACDPIVFVLLNPPRALLATRLAARAAAGTHFMPASLLDSQLQQLEVPDPSELYMCFGALPRAGCSNSSDAVCGSSGAGDGDAFPDAQAIVAAILAHARH